MDMLLRSIRGINSWYNFQVIFPALDLRVKNVTYAYSLEHQVEINLFDQMFLLLTAALKEKGSAPMELRRELICCTEAIQTTLCQHFSKEEEQVSFLLYFRSTVVSIALLPNHVINNHILTWQNAAGREACFFAVLDVREERALCRL